MTSSSRSALGLVAGMRDTLTARRVFSDPVVVDGVTVVLAAAIRGAGGAGAGTNANGENGDGGGLFATARPVGAYVIHGSSVTWRPAVDVTHVIIAAGLVVSAYLLRRTRQNGGAGPSATWTSVRSR
jgi:hypothetical protein